MSALEAIALRIENYKCFGEKAQGFDRIRSMNLVIGRNNSGKSALLDLVQYVIKPFDLRPLSHLGAVPAVEVELGLTEEALKRVFREGTSGGLIGSDHWKFARSWVAKPIRYEVQTGDHFRFRSVEPSFPGDKVDNNDLALLARAMGNPVSSMKVGRLAAARDIVPEKASARMHIDPDGNGATTLLQNFINGAQWSSKAVEVELLRELNAIVSPDAHFTRITTQLDPDGEKWGVYLEESQKGRIALVHSGSGIKTIILVLCLLHLVPSVESADLGQYAFAFEELENNLHPALQRRLLAYLQAFAKRTGATFFLTTHSSVAIDLFAADDDAQIVHVTHNGLEAKARCTLTHVDNRGVCDDLDVRASDLLQANAVVWVEGPSDRLYFNRWIDLWSHGVLKEGLHYQCVFYGGRLLSHLSSSDPADGPESAIKILRVNGNAVMLIDSDRRAPAGDLNATKTRIVNEVTAAGGLAWVTQGREIENYLPMEAVIAQYPAAAGSTLQQYQSLVDFLNSVQQGEGDRFQRIKVDIAERSLPLIDRPHLERHLDLAERLDEICGRLIKWNGGVVH